MKKVTKPTDYRMARWAQVLVMATMEIIGASFAQGLDFHALNSVSKSTNLVQAKSLKNRAPMTVSAIGTSSLSTTSTTVIYNTSLPGTSKVIFSLDSTLANGIVKYDGALTTNHALSLDGLQAGKKYFYRVSSANPNSSYIESAILSFQTPSDVAIFNPLFIPLVSSEWSVPYNGYGYVNFDAGTNSVVFAPMTSATALETHAAVLLANKYLANPVRNLKITIDAATEQQLRSPTPNAWEVFWIFFNYSVDTTGHKKTNYFTLKPNGGELGTAFEDVGQKFLATSSDLNLAMNQHTIYVIEKIDGTVKISINGVQVMNYNNPANPIYDAPGTVGLYTEDARVRVYSVKVEK